jgi:hypothetical protein
MQSVVVELEWGEIARADFLLIIVDNQIDILTLL